VLELELELELDINGWLLELELDINGWLELELDINGWLELELELLDEPDEPGDKSDKRVIFITMYPVLNIPRASDIFPLELCKPFESKRN
jgi:hypothetical protein